MLKVKFQVVVVGGSYSATMATWAREKYPHLIDIAYASSAPLRAIKDFHGKIILCSLAGLE